MQFIFETLRNYLPHILAMSVLYLVATFFSGAHVLGLIMGSAILAPLQLSILKGKPLDSSTLIRNIFCMTSLYYTGLFWAVWVIPICAFGLLGLVVDLNIVWIFAIPVYAFLYAKMAPTLYKIATGTQGEKLLFIDMINIAIVMLVYSIAEFADKFLISIDKDFAFINLIGMSFIFILTFSVQSAIVVQRNKEYSISEKEERLTHKN